MQPQDPAAHQNVSICALCHGRVAATRGRSDTNTSNPPCPLEQTERKHHARPHRPSWATSWNTGVCCFLSRQVFLLLPACPVRRNLRSNLPRRCSLTRAYSDVPCFALLCTHFGVVHVTHVSQRIAGRGSNRLATDPRSWACILPAGECSSVRLWQRPYMFAARRARSGRSTSLGEQPGLCSSVKRGLPRVLVRSKKYLWVRSCLSRTTAMQCTLQLSSSIM